MTTQLCQAQGVELDYMTHKRTLKTNRTEIPGVYFFVARGTVLGCLISAKP